MHVISKHFGFVLVFENKGQLSTVVEHLQSMLEAANKDLMEAPYLYSLYSDGKMNGKNMEKELNRLKKRLS